MARTSVAALAARVATALLGLLTVPVLVRTLGVDGYGTYAAVVALSTVLVFVDQGLAVGARSAVADALARNDLAKADAAYFVAHRAIQLVGVALAILAIVLSLVVPWTRLLDRPDAHASLLVGTYLVSCCLVLASAAPLRVLEGRGRTALVATLPIAGSLWVLLTALLGDQLDLPLGYFVVCAGLTALPAYVLGVVLLRRQVGRPRLPRHAGRPLLRSMWQSSWPMAVISTMLALLSGLAPVVVAARLTVDDVAVFAAVAKVSVIAMVVVTAASPVMWTHFVRQRALGNSVSVRASRQMTMSLAALALLVGVALVALGPWFVETWIGFAPADTRVIFTAFATLVFVTALQLVPGNAQNDSPGLRFQVVTTTLTAVAALPLALVLTSQVGSAGPILAAAGAMLLFHTIPLWCRWLMNLHGSEREFDHGNT